MNSIKVTESPHYDTLQLVHKFSVLPGTYRQKKDHEEHNHNMEVCSPHIASP